MKRTDLIKQLKKAGFAFERHGNNHDVYIRNTEKGVDREIVPRHREINEKLARKILGKWGLL